MQVILTSLMRKYSEMKLSPVNNYCSPLDSGIGLFILSHLVMSKVPYLERDRFGSIYRIT